MTVHLNASVCYLRLAVHNYPTVFNNTKSNVSVVYSGIRICHNYLSTKQVINVEWEGCNERRIIAIIAKYGGGVAAYVRSLLVSVCCSYFPHTDVFLKDYLNNCNFSKHRLMRSLMMV